MHPGGILIYIYLHTDISLPDEFCLSSLFEAVLKNPATSYELLF